MSEAYEDAILEAGGDGSSWQLTPKERRARIASSGNTRHVTIPYKDGSKRAEYTISFAFMSQRGFYPDNLNKPNQDECCARENFRDRANEMFFGVFDGHGEEGALCARFVRKNLPETLKDTCGNKSLKRLNHVIYKSAFDSTNDKLHQECIDDVMSGTTAVTAHINGRTLLVSNVGDSRAVMAVRSSNSGSLRAINLSKDHTPFRADEQERVRNCGAYVLSLEQIEGRRDPSISFWASSSSEDLQEEGDPPRVWAPNGMYPGTAFTRSIGDSAAESIGVIPEPELTEVELTSDCEFVVLASDGVFEFMSSQTVVDIVKQFEDQHDACTAVVQEAYRLWLQFEIRTDDISIVIISFTGLQNQRSEDNQLRMERHSSTGAPRPLRSATTRSKVAAIEAHSGHDDEGELTPELEEQERIALQTPKSEEELNVLKEATKVNFLFQGISEEQRQRMFSVMNRLDVSPGTVIIRQGDKGNACYILKEGVLDVYVADDWAENQAKQEARMTSVAVGDNGDEGTDGETYDGNEDSQKDVKANAYTNANSYGIHVLTYSVEGAAHPCFGEVALIHNKPRSATVVARTAASMWSLSRSTYKRVLRQEQDAELLSALRDLEVFRRMTTAELCRITENLTRTEYLDGESIVLQGHPNDTLFIIAHGRVKGERRNATEDEDAEPLEAFSLGKGEAFGADDIRTSSGAVYEYIADTNVQCMWIDLKTIEKIVGPLDEHDEACKQRDERASRYGEMPQPIPEALEGTEEIGPNQLSSWKVYCSIGAIQLMSGWNDKKHRWFTLFAASLSCAENRGTTKALSRALKEMRRLHQMPYVPGFREGLIDQKWLSMLVQTEAIGTLGMLLRGGMNENAAAFYTACVSLAIDHLHWQSLVFRGLSPYNMLVDRRGHIALVDFRFAKRDDGRSYTLCGDPEFRAPEMITAKGHDAAVDWWSVGVFAWWLLRHRTPFEAESESDTAWGNDAESFKRLLHGEYTVPSTFSRSASEFVQTLLEPDVTKRVRATSRGVESIRRVEFFQPVDFNALASPNAVTDVYPPENVRTALFDAACDEDAITDEPLSNVHEAESLSWLNANF